VLWCARFAGFLHTFSRTASSVFSRTASSVLWCTRFAGFLHKFSRTASFVLWCTRLAGFLHRFSRTSSSVLWCLVPCYGVPDLLASSIGLLELIAPCGCMTELLAPLEVIFVGRFVTTGESLLLLISQLSQFSCSYQLPWFVSQKPLTSTCLLFCHIIVSINMTFFKYNYSTNKTT
jgi:hypothetical protein